MTVGPGWVDAGQDTLGLRARRRLGTAGRQPFAAAGSVPAVPGLLIRHLRTPDDYPAMNAIANAVRAGNGDGFYTTDEQFQLFHDNLPGSDPARDVAYLADMPTVQRVAAKFVGTDAFDTAARRYAALERLDELMGKLIGDRDVSGWRRPRSAPFATPTSTAPAGSVW